MLIHTIFDLTAWLAAWAIGSFIARRGLGGALATWVSAACGADAHGARNFGLDPAGRFGEIAAQSDQPEAFA